MMTGILADKIGGMRPLTPKELETNDKKIIKKVSELHLIQNLNFW